MRAAYFLYGLIQSSIGWRGAAFLFALAQWLEQLYQRCGRGFDSRVSRQPLGLKDAQLAFCAVTRRIPHTLAMCGACVVLCAIMRCLMRVMRCPECTGVAATKPANK
jgi:hypothetical protein